MVVIYTFGMPIESEYTPHPSPDSETAQPMTREETGQKIAELLKYAQQIEDRNKEIDKLFKDFLGNKPPMFWPQLLRRIESQAARANATNVSEWSLEAEVHDPASTMVRPVSGRIADPRQHMQMMQGALSSLNAVPEPILRPTIAAKSE